MRRYLSRRALIIWASVAVTLLAVVGAFHDLPAVGHALRTFDWRLLPLAAGLSMTMHLLRFARWHLYARRVANGALGLGDSLLIYGAGMGTHLTPGRVGEAVRCAFLRRAAATPLSRSAPIILAERVTDGIGLLGVALPGALVLRIGGPVTSALLCVPLLFLPLFASARVHAALLRAGERVPFIHRHLQVLVAAGAELRGLLTPRLLAAAAALSLASVALEAATFAVVLKGVGLTLTGETLWKAAFVLPAAMLASALFIVPGNLGVAEGGLAALTRVTLSLSAAAAAGAAILVRLCTLWLGLAVGAVALAVATHRWGRATAEPVPVPVPTTVG